MDFGGIKMTCGQYVCGEGEYEGRRFLTKGEKVKRLEDYKEWLDSESKGVDEVISKLKKAS